MTSSSEDSTAPLDFRVSSSVSDNSKSDYQAEGCPLCLVPRKSFHCQDCIRNGDFIHSSSTSRCAQRFSDKKVKLSHYKFERNKQEKLCEDKLTDILKNNKLITEVNVSKEKIKLLRQIIQDKKEAILKLKECSYCLTESNRKRTLRLPQYEERVKKLESYVKVKNTEKKDQEELLNKAQEQLKAVIRTSIKQLIDYIFPISIIKPCNSDSSDTVSALAEASRTAYIRGKWVFTDISSEIQHCIVAPSLPSSGDYSSYNDWVSANKDAVPGTNNDAVEHNPAYNISAALTYTTQLVNLLAFFLDVRLPSKLNYSEFCGNELNEERFARRVARLNWNIVSLCLSQNVRAHLINPQSTLQNILYLLDPDTSELGKSGASNVTPEDSKLLEDALKPALEAYSDSEDSEDDSDNLPCEWEAVPNVCLPEVSSGAVSFNQVSQQQISTSSVAGGLMTSAAASIASFLRGWTNK